MASINLGLIGWPVEHSVSPQLQAGALRSVGLDGQYRLYPVAPMPAGEGDFEALLDRLRSGSLQGLNVTIPHKQTAYRRVDKLTNTARAVGAVNTLYIKEGALWGDNTDVLGFVRDLVDMAAVTRQVLVLGAGGAARAVVYGLALEGWSVIYLAARRLVQAEQLVAALMPAIQVWPLKNAQAGDGGSPVKILPLEMNADSLAEVASELDLVVNTTPVGMSPQLDVSPWPAQVPWPAGAAAYDLVYNPAETRFLQMAAAACVPCRGGLGMLVEQAALAFERWTGLRPDRNQMLENL